MRVTVISQNQKRKTAMLTIVHDGISETRHCQYSPGGWRGYVLDADKAHLTAMERTSIAASAALKAGGRPVAPYVANPFFVYCPLATPEEVRSAYRAHLAAEVMSARTVGERQRIEAEKMHAEQEAKRAEQKRAA